MTSSETPNRFASRAAASTTQWAPSATMIMVTTIAVELAQSGQVFEVQPVQIHENALIGGCREYAKCAVEEDCTPLRTLPQ